ncbi:pilin [Patescibacteria group bacterium]|nr:pilin [Patescibacteria group bacterium]
MRNRVLKGFLVLGLVSTMFFGGTLSVFAAEGDQQSPQTILPIGDKDGNRYSVAECEEKLMVNIFNAGGESAPAFEEDRSLYLYCALVTGQIKFWMVPYYISYILEFLIGISGLLCVLAIVIGGFFYLFSGISEDKETGKKAILYGLIGMILTLTAWALVNIIIGVLSS